MEMEIGYRVLEGKSKEEIKLEADFWSTFCLSQSSGPIADWGLSIWKECNWSGYADLFYRSWANLRHRRYQYLTRSIELILCGFHEAAIMMLRFQYDTQIKN